MLEFVTVARVDKCYGQMFVILLGNSIFKRRRGGWGGRVGEKSGRVGWNNNANKRGGECAERESFFFFFFFSGHYYYFLFAVATLQFSLTQEWDTTTRKSVCIFAE